MIYFILGIIVGLLIAFLVMMVTVTVDTTGKAFIKKITKSDKAIIIKKQNDIDSFLNDN